MSASGDLEAFATGSSSRFDALASAGKKALEGISVLAVSAGVASMKLASDYEASMLMIRTQAGATQDEVDKMSKAILDLAPQVGESPKALAEGLYYIESAGHRGADALETLKVAAEGARVGNEDLTATAHALVSVLASGVGGVKDITDAMGQMDAIIGNGQMHMADLNEALTSGILSAAKNFGVDLQSVGAALDVLTTAGEPAAQAATRLRMSLSLLGAPSKQAANILQELGLSADDAASDVSKAHTELEGLGVNFTRLATDLRQPNGIYVALQDLKTQLEKTGLSAEEQGAVISRAFGGGRSGAAIMTLMNDLDGLKGKFEAVGEQSGRFQQSWEATTKTSKQQLADVTALVEKWGVQLGDQLIPKLREAVMFMDEHRGATLALAEAVGGALTLAIGAYILQQAKAFGVAVIGNVRSLITAVTDLGRGMLMAAGAEEAAAGGMTAFVAGAAGLTGIVGIGIAVFSLYTSRVQASKKAVEEATQAHKAWADQFVATARLSADSTQIITAEYKKLSDAFVKAFESGNQAKAHELEGAMRALAGATKDTTAATDAYAQALQGSLGHALSMAEATASYTEQVEQLRSQIDNESQSTESNSMKQAELTAQLASVIRAASQDVDAMVAVGQVHDDAASKAQALRNMLGQLEQKFPELAGPIEAYKAQLDSIPRYVETTVETQFVNSHVDRYGTGEYAPGYAEGGLIDRPTLALVGEAGRELILPLTNMSRTFQLLNQAGLVQPFQAPTPIAGGTTGSGGAGVVNIYVSMPAGRVLTSRDLAREIRQELVATTYRVGDLRFSPR
jgi:TP901 family phage tail tape measure protein